MGRQVKDNKALSFLQEWGVSCICAIAILCCLGYLVFGRNISSSLSKDDVKADISESQILKIGELSTVRCYYHNVAEASQDAKGLLSFGPAKVGYKKYWVEYYGYANVGVDTNEMVVGKLSDDGVIQIYMPDAKVLDIDADTENMDNPISETGLFTQISTEEKMNAYEKAQETMKEQASADTTILNKAKNNAKTIIENYIKSIDSSYSVEWVSDSSLIK